MRGGIGAALLAAALAGCGQGGQGGQQRAASPAVPLDQAAARLPASVAGFDRGGTTWDERERPGLGVSVDYAGPARAAVATVTLYDRGSGAVEPRLPAEFSSAVGDVVAAAGTRTSQQIAERERREVPVPGGAPLSCSLLEGTYGRQEVRTLLCLGSAAGRFLKVQVTSPARQVRPVDPLPFVVGVTQAARGA